MLNDARKESRFDVPDPCQKYLKLMVRKDGELVPAVIGNFSRHGILFECPQQFGRGERTECILRANTSVNREITFGIEVKYCYENKNRGSFIMGASVTTITEEPLFDVFERIFDFVVLRQGKK